MEELKTAVLLIIWRRLEETKLVFGRIAEAQPPRLYVASDGPRSDAERREVELCREFILSNLNWPCEIHTKFERENLGCGLGVSSAISWFFKSEDEGIILEDDCLASPDFFRYCDELLDYYRGDTRIWCISGANFQGGIVRGEASYYFSKYNPCWGWATWRRCWNKYDFLMQEWEAVKDDVSFKSFFSSEKEEEYWRSVLSTRYRLRQPDTWDYQWTFSCMINCGLTAIPNVNLVTNIGFGPKATHTFTWKGPTQKLGTLKGIRHPKVIRPCDDADKMTFGTIFAPKTSGKDRLKSLAHKFIRLFRTVR